MIEKMCSQKKGYVLVYVILTIMLAAILAVSLYNAIFLTNKLFMQVQYNKRAYYMAVSGVECGRYVVKSNRYDFNLSNPILWPSFTFSSGGVVTVTVQRTGVSPNYAYTITSTGNYPGTGAPAPSITATKTITATCTATGSITSWQ